MHDMKQIRMYKAKIEWAERQLSRVNFTHDQLEEMIQSAEANLDWLIKDRENATRAGNWNKVDHDDQ